MTAALLLAAVGGEVMLLERVAEPAAVGAGVVLQSNGLAWLYTALRRLTSAYPKVPTSGGRYGRRRGRPSRR